MIFGDPYRFAIWVEYVPQWGDSYKNGLLYFVINGVLHPGDVRTSTLLSDLNEIIDEKCALIAHPKNEMIFNLTKKDAFNQLYTMAYPKSDEDDEYPEQVFDYSITPPNISEFGGCFFAVANDTSLRIIGGVTERLVKSTNEGENTWEYIPEPSLEDVTISINEINEIINSLREYVDSILR